MSDDPGENGLIGGREKREIVVVPYDQSWPATFEIHRDRIAAALGTDARRIDHVGSTAVPGLPAKAIIDVDLSVDDIEDEPAYLPALQRAGYCLRVREPGHRMVRTPDLAVHVHICQTGSDWERRHLLFRDRLRADPADRAGYAELKTRLARHEWTDMTAYADAKGPLIAEITDRAERWAAKVGWAPG